MLQQTIEGTWEEILENNAELIGQRVLDIFWMVHNFVLSHFTTKKVPAVALGIIQKGLTWEDLLQIRVIC